MKLEEKRRGRKEKGAYMRVGGGGRVFGREKGEEWSGCVEVKKEGACGWNQEFASGSRKR